MLPDIFKFGVYGTHQVNKEIFEESYAEAARDGSSKPEQNAVAQVIAQAIIRKDYGIMPPGQDNFHPEVFGVYANIGGFVPKFVMCIDNTGSGDENESYFVSVPKEPDSDFEYCAYFDSNDNEIAFLAGNVTRSHTYSKVHLW